MTNHTSAAYSAVAKAIKNKNNKTNKERVTAAKRIANNTLKGAGGNKAILKGAAQYLATHPNSKNAQKMVKHVVKIN